MNVSGVFVVLLAGVLLVMGLRGTQAAAFPGLFGTQKTDRKEDTTIVATQEPGGQHRLPYNAPLSTGPTFAHPFQTPSAYRSVS